VSKEKIVNSALCQSLVW